RGRDCGRSCISADRTQHAQCAAASAFITLAGWTVADNHRSCLCRRGALLSRLERRTVRPYIFSGVRPAGISMPTRLSSACSQTGGARVALATHARPASADTSVHSVHAPANSLAPGDIGRLRLLVETAGGLEECPSRRRSIAVWSLNKVARPCEQI